MGTDSAEPGGFTEIAHAYCITWLQDSNKYVRIEILHSAIRSSMVANLQSVGL